MNKTPIQELIERLERNIEQMPNEVNSLTKGYKAGLNFVIACATTSLEKEKKAIESAYNNAKNYPDANTDGAKYYFMNYISND